MLSDGHERGDDTNLLPQYVFYSYPIGGTGAAELAHALTANHTLTCVCWA